MLPQLALLLGGAALGVSAADSAATVAAIDGLTEIFIYTKQAAPFTMLPTGQTAPYTTSGNALAPPSGYSMDFLKALLGKVQVIQSNNVARTPTHGDWSAGWSANDMTGIVNVEAPVCQDATFCGNSVGKTGNTAIFEKVQSSFCDPVQHPTRLCIGAASISMTSDRETGMDFLPSYYGAGLQVMSTMESSSMKKAWNFAKNLFGMLAGIVAALFATTVIVVPIVFLLETAFAGQHSSRPSIFYVPDEVLDEADTDGLLVSDTTRFVAGIKLATVWTGCLFLGSAVGKPSSAPGVVIRALGKGVFMVVKVVVFAGATAMLAESTANHAIKDFSELGGKTICINGGSSVVKNYMTARNSLGYTVKDTYTGIDQMFAGFWARECEAVVYDYPLLKYELIAHAERCTADKADGATGALMVECDSGGALVGDVLTHDPYGIVIPQNHNLAEKLKQVTIDTMVTDSLMVSLDEKYMAQPADDQGGGTVRIGGSDVKIGWFIGAPLISTTICMLCAFLYTRMNRVALEEKNKQMALTNDTQDYSLLVYDILKKGKADIITTNDSDLIHSMAGQMRDLQKLVLDTLLIVDKRQTPKSFLELQAIYDDPDARLQTIKSTSIKRGEALPQEGLPPMNP